MKKLIAFCVLSLVLALVVPVLPISGEQKVYTDTIRLHVIANSDDDADQALKLKVRDAVLETVGCVVEGMTSKEEAEAALEKNLGAIKRSAESAVRAEGRSDAVAVTLTTENYPTRSYADFTLPAGDYTSLRVMIGEARGHNWWCVLFPPLCTSSAEPREEFIRAGFTGEQIRVLTDDDDPKYVLRFRILEFFESIFS